MSNDNWISVDDGVPAYGVEVLACEIDESFRDYTDIFIATYTYKDEWYKPFKNIKVTHWQPLPEPPKVIKTNKNE